MLEVWKGPQVLMTRPREEWRQDVSARYRALEKFSKDDSRLQFLRILRSMPYGASSSFLLPASLSTSSVGKALGVDDAETF